MCKQQGPALDSGAAIVRAAMAHAKASSVCGQCVTHCGIKNVAAQEKARPGNRAGLVDYVERKDQLLIFSRSVST